MLAAAPLVYLFGIVRAPAEPLSSSDAKTAGGAEFGPCRTLLQGSLLAVVSDLRLEEGETLDNLMCEPATAQDLILHHHRVLEGMASQTAVIPLRFGSVFSDDEVVRSMLARGHDAFLDEIDGLDGAAEWGLKVFCNRNRLGERLSREKPEIADLRARVSNASEGKAFFLQRQLERLISAETDRAIVCCLDDAERRLDSVSRCFARGKTQPARLHGREAEMVFNGAFLVLQGGEDAFLEIVDDLRGACLGFDYEITGPWPPYSFVDCGLHGGENAA